MENKNDKKLQFVELRAKGNSYERIAKEIGVAKSTLINWAQELDVELSNQRALEWDRLADEYKVGSRHQIETLVVQLDRVKEEMIKRDLSDVPTEKLLEMQFKLMNRVREYNPTPYFIARGLDLSLNDKHGWHG